MLYYRSRRILGKTIDSRLDKGAGVASGEVGTAALRCRRRLFRVMADGNDIRRGPPYFRFRQHITPGRHPKGAALLTLGNRFEDISRVAQIAVGQVDATIAVRPVTVRAMFLQKQFTSSRDH